MFHFYSAQDKHDWGEHNREFMNIREFVRFTFQHRVIPILLERPEDCVKLFKQAVKAEGTATQHLNFSSFKKSLVRIAVFAQDSIGGQREDLLSERMRRATKERAQGQRKKEKVKKTLEDKAKNENMHIEEMKSEFKQLGQKGPVVDP